MQLDVDVAAQRILDDMVPKEAVLVTIVNSYGLPGASLTVERYPRAWVAHDPDIVLMSDSFGTSIYAHRRVAAYGCWQPLRLTGHGAGWWRYLSLVDTAGTWRNMLRWEALHPSLSHPNTPRPSSDAA